MPGRSKMAACWGAAMFAVAAGAFAQAAAKGKVPVAHPGGGTHGLLDRFIAVSDIPDIAVAVALCAVYWGAMVVVRWNRVAMFARWSCRGQIASVRAELVALEAPPQSVRLAELRRLLQQANDVLDGPKDKSGNRWLNYLFWSRGQEMIGWGYVHEAQTQMVPLLPEPTVRVRLESAESKLRAAGDAGSRALADAINRALTSSPQADIARLQALLAEALSANYQREDTSFAELVSWQNKTSWLVACGLLLILALTGAFPKHAILFLVGAAGGLLSRLSRSLDRKDVPTDYGASWTTLFLSPVAGAIGAWAAILLMHLAINLNVLGKAFDVAWKSPTDPLTLAVALVFGFSERLLDSVFDKLQEKALQGSGAQTPAPLAITDPGLTGTANAAGSAQLQATGTTGTLTWSLAAGASAGLALTPDGKLTWTARQAGDYPFTAQVQDQKSQAKATRDLALKIA